MNTQIYLEIYDTISMLIRLATPQSVLCTVTTGHRYFAVCQRHTANALPCVAHGKRFAVCSTRQSHHGNQASAKGFFAVGSLSGTLQRICHVQNATLGKKKAGDGG